MQYASTQELFNYKIIQRKQKKTRHSGIPLLDTLESRVIHQTLHIDAISRLTDACVTSGTTNHSFWLFDILWYFSFEIVC